MVDTLLANEDCEGDGTGVSLAKALLPKVETTTTTTSPTLLPWVCSTRYKTELCTSYSATGFCKYSERCQFAHGLHELHIPFHHPKYKTELCRSYHTTGYCYYGSRCLFVHSPAEQRHAHRRRRNVPCRTFCSFGICPFGTRCNFLHVEGRSLSVGENSASPYTPTAKESKPRLPFCHTFATFGFCLNGTRCRFQHGLPDKTKPSAQAQGSPFLNPLPGLSLPTSPGTATSRNSSTSSSSPPISPLVTPSGEAGVHNAFTFSSQQLSDLLLPLALHLQQLENGKAQDAWENRGF